MPRVSHGSVAVPAGAVSITVSGTFTVPYAVAPSPNWPGAGEDVTAQSASAWTATFMTPAPLGGGTLFYILVEPDVAPVSVAGALTAGTIINNVRDDIPDPVYDAAGTPQPDTNGGLFRASTLYRWLNVGVRRAARICGAIIEDWTALPQVAFQPWYPVDLAFLKLDSGFSNQWPIDTIALLEEDTLWPATSLSTAQSLWGYTRKRAERLEFGLWPVPSLTDPSTTLVSGILASSADPIALTSTASFLSFGYVQIDSEILQYQRLSTAPTGIRTISRGVCGTSAASHNAGATVQHLGLWLKGHRIPAAISASTSLVELPLDIADILEDYLLARCRRSEQEFQEGSRLWKQFDDDCRAIKADPSRQPNRWQVPIPGEARVGPLYGGGGGVIVP